MERLNFVADQLFTPGPTPTPTSVKLAYQMTEVYHRSKEFELVFRNCIDGLKPFFGSERDPVILTCSGTGAMEAAVSNLTNEGDMVGVIECGKFGNRWRKICEAFKCNVKSFEIEMGKGVQWDTLDNFFEKSRDLNVLFLQAHETSTGALIPFEQIAKIAKLKMPNLLVVIDAISCLGAHRVHMRDLGLDCVIAGSQKGFGVAPGLSFIALNDRAWERISGRSRFYFDLKKEAKGQATGRSAYTPAISVVLGLWASLQEIKKIGGVDAFIHHHQRMALAFRAAISEMQLDFFVEETLRSNVLTSVKIPESLDGIKLLEIAKKRYGAIISGGQDELKGKIFRFSHLGFVSEFQLISGISALEFALSDLKWRHEVGTGVKSAMSSLQETRKTIPNV